MVHQPARRRWAVLIQADSHAGAAPALRSGYHPRIQGRHCHAHVSGGRRSTKAPRARVAPWQPVPAGRRLLQLAVAAGATGLVAGRRPLEAGRSGGPLLRFLCCALYPLSPNPCAARSARERWSVCQELNAFSVECWRPAVRIRCAARAVWRLSRSTLTSIEPCYLPCFGAPACACVAEGFERCRGRRLARVSSSPLTVNAHTLRRRNGTLPHQSTKNSRATGAEPPRSTGNGEPMSTFPPELLSQKVGLSGRPKSLATRFLDARNPCSCKPAPAAPPPAPPC